MASSSHPKPRHLLHPFGGATAAPPPTPSTQPNLSAASDAVDTLSRLLHRLPPNLSLPTRLSPRAAASAPSPTFPLPSSDSLSPLPLSFFELGYFQLTHHPITQQLAESAESESLSLFDLPHHQKLSSFPKDWPLGFDDEDADTASFCLDGACSTKSETELGLASLRELTRELEKVGLEVVESLASAVGLENPFAKKGGGGGDDDQRSSLMWVSSGDDKEGRVYPYVVGLQYQIRSRKLCLLSDSGSVNVEPDVGSVLVTLGDIAQVWSNGRLKKVRGRPFANLHDTSNSNSPFISMTLLLTLPLESTVLPLHIIRTKIDAEIGDCKFAKKDHYEEGKDDQDQSVVETSKIDEGDEDGEDQRVFNSFSFEDYAWRVYHDRFALKDPLDRYRIVH